MQWVPSRDGERLGAPSPITRECMGLLVTASVCRAHRPRAAGQNWCMVQAGWSRRHAMHHRSQPDGNYKAEGLRNANIVYFCHGVCRIKLKINFKYILLRYVITKNCCIKFLVDSFAVMLHSEHARSTRVIASVRELDVHCSPRPIPVQLLWFPDTRTFSHDSVATRILGYNCPATVRGRSGDLSYRVQW